MNHSDYRSNGTIVSDNSTLPTVVLRKIKANGYFGRWPAYQVSSDEQGHWLYSPKGTVYHGHPKGSGVVKWEVGRGPMATEGSPEMHLIPHAGWWVAKWNLHGGDGRITVHICKPPTLKDKEWSFVDLELDPFLNEDGEVEVLDEDEFQEAIRLGQISLREERNAIAATEDIIERLRKGTEPFGSLGRKNWDESLASGLPPIRNLPPLQKD